ncbi:MAG TPA: AAA family ATPase [Polyangia bacterium]|nr:AAA family ATPase [Polyangia bacterium]
MGPPRYEIGDFCVYPVVRISDGTEFLAKAPKEDFPSLHLLKDLEHELLLLQGQRPQPSGVLRPIYRLDDNRNTYVVFEFFEGKPAVGAAIENLQGFLRFAIALLAALDECHRMGLVHRGLDPASVLWDQQAQSIRLTHFIHAASASHLASGSFPLSTFSAPELTGQLNVEPDHRADLYSAGAVLYHQLAGSLLFSATDDPAELVHNLVAKQPQSLAACRPDLPAALVHIVSRLLAKSPSDRPGTASEVFLELSAIEAALQQSPTLVTPRVPASLGTSRMHGRSMELERLVRAIDETANGAMRAVFVAGSAGTGKSRLIQELRPMIHHSGRMIASGKFEQYRRSRPYSAMLDAVERLVEQLLSGPEAQLEYWRARLSAIEPSLLNVLAEQIPQLTFLIGKQPPPMTLLPAEAQNRFQNAFRALATALCDRNHPLVFVIDDLQWSDDETVGLLAEVFLRSRPPFLTLILAYRPREAEHSPALIKLISSACEPQVGDEHAGELRVQLDRLSLNDVRAICSDIVSPCDNPDVLSLFVHRSCRGNPLFATEIINRLRRNGGLRWMSDADGSRWMFRVDDQTDIRLSENVVDLIVGRIDALPDSCRRVMVTASCVGHSFELEALRVATGLTMAEVEEAVSLAHAEGLVLPASEGASPDAFLFFHDRVQQAAHSLASEAESARLHTVLGRWLLTRIEEGKEALFAAIEHLNPVSAALEEAERKVLSELNLRAGRLAKQAIAYTTATALFEKALALTEETASDDHALRFQARINLAESLYLTARFDLAEVAFEAALAEARTTSEEVEVHRTRLILYQHMQRYGEAISLGLRALRLLGVPLPEKPSPARLVTALGALMLRVRKVPIDSLADAPDRADARDRAVLDLLVLLWTPTFWVNQPLNGLIVVKLMAMVLRLGNTPQAPMAYVCFGILNHVLFKAHRRGLLFGRLAFDTLGETPDPFIASRVRFLGLTFFGTLERDNRENVGRYEEALARCISDGEHVFGGHTIDGITTSLPIQGFRLSDIEHRLETCAKMAHQISSGPSEELIRIIRHWCADLSRSSDVAASALGPENIQYKSYVGVYQMLQMASCYLWRDEQRVMEIARQLRRNIVIQSNPLHAAFYALFTVLGGCYGSRMRASGLVRASMRRLRAIAAVYPRNFRSMLRLAQAEVHRHKARNDEAVSAYHDAIGEAAALGHDLIHAIGCERLADFYERRGNATERQREYLTVAAYSYARFGAAAKVREMVRRHPGLDVATPTSGGQEPPGRTVDLGVEAVMRAAYAIAEETRSDRLARNLLRVITTSAGGQRGLLVRPDGPRWRVLAGWQSQDLNESGDHGTSGEGMAMSEPIIRYVARTQKVLRLKDPATDERFRTDPYLRERQPRSILCLPLLHRGELSAVLYLENSVCADVFTSDQLKLATLLGHQAAISMAVADYHKVEMDALQAKINPHFLYNTLSVVAELIVKDPGTAEAAVLKLSNLYRYVLSSSSDQIVTLDDELLIARNYLTLEQYRFGERLSIEFDVVGPTAGVHVPALIFQPIVENSVRHGIARKIGPGRVRVAVVVGKKSCRLSVEDDGPGWQEPTSREGFGLLSVRRRLKLLYQDNFSLEISKGPGVRVDITIPTGTSGADMSL